MDLTEAESAWIEQDARERPGDYEPAPVAGTPPRAVKRISVAAVDGVTEISSGAGQVFTSGRDALRRFRRPALALRVTVTPRGHWYRSDDEKDGFSNDTVCRGCTAKGHFDYILDNTGGWCPKPPTVVDVARALLPEGSAAREAFEDLVEDWEAQEQERCESAQAQYDQMWG